MFSVGVLEGNLKRIRIKYEFHRIGSCEFLRERFLAENEQPRYYSTAVSCSCYGDPVVPIYTYMFPGTFLLGPYYRRLQRSTQYGAAERDLLVIFSQEMVFSDIYAHFDTDYASQCFRRI